MMSAGSARAADAQVADAQVEVEYTLHIAGLQLATFGLSGDFSKVRYQISGKGESAGLARLIASFNGWTKSAGAISGDNIRPATYSLDFSANRKRQAVEMGFTGGTVQELAVYPPEPPSPLAIPVTLQHRAGVLDPVSAVVLPIPPGEITGNSVCDRRLPIFDGRHRYDLVLSFKRVEAVPVAGHPNETTNIFVCKIKYFPIAGHKPKKEATEYWAHAEDIELWLAPIRSAGVFIPYRALMPTPIGQATFALSKLSVEAPERSTAAIGVKTGQ